MTLSFLDLDEATRRRRLIHNHVRRPIVDRCVIAGAIALALAGIFAVAWHIGGAK